MTLETHRIDFPKDHSVSAMVPWFVDAMLRDAAERNVAKIIFKRHATHKTSDIDGRDISASGYITIELEFGNPMSTSNSTRTGVRQEVKAPPICYWTGIVARLKVLARMSDYGPQRSTCGTIVLHDDDRTKLVFVLENNPNPFKDTEVVVKVGATETVGTAGIGRTGRLGTSL